VTRLFLIRHGRSTWNAEHRIQGHADPPLDGVGQEQARRLAERLRQDPPVGLYTSPQRRALGTAEIIGHTLGVPVVPDERLKERDVGDVMGLTWQQVVEQFPDLARRWVEASESVEIPGEEDTGAFRARVVAVFDDILTRFPEEPVAVVSHGGTLGAYLNHLLGRTSRFSPFSFDNASLSIVQVKPARNPAWPHVRLLNDTCHLRGEAS
jgi:probable phosphoglycerate mutase